MTSLTVECMATYEDCLNKTCDVVDANIKVIIIIIMIIFFDWIVM